MTTICVLIAMSTTGAIAKRLHSTLSITALCLICFNQPRVARGQVGDLALPTQMELSRLVDLAADRLAVSIDYDAAALKAVATLRMAEGVDARELWTLTNRVLVTRGLTTVRLPGERAYAVVRLSEAAGVGQVMSEDDARRVLALMPVPDGKQGAAGEGDPAQQPVASQTEPPAGYLAVRVEVMNVAARDLVEPVSRVLSKPGGSVVALGERMLLVSDLTMRIEQALTLIDHLDSAKDASVVEEIRLSSFSGDQAAVLAQQIKAKREAAGDKSLAGDVVQAPGGRSVFVIAPPSSIASWRALIAQLDEGDRIETVTYPVRSHDVRELAALIEEAVRDEGDDRWRLVTDELSGGLIVTGTPAQHARVGEIIGRVESLPAQSRRQTRTIVVQNRDVVELTGVLESLLSSGAMTSSAASQETTNVATGALASENSSRENGGAGAQPESGLRPVQARDLSIASDERTNTLILSGEPRAVQQAEAIVRELDVRQPQVMLDVLLVTLTDSDTLALGVELERIGVTDNLVYRLSSLFGLGARTAAGDLTAPASAAGFSGVVLDPGDYAVVVRALQTLNRGRSLSMPRLLVGNNQQAALNSVVQQPFASVNASNTVSTTSLGGTKDAGTVVTITPQIAPGDHLTLEYSVSLSAFVGAATDPTLPPPRQENSVSSVATIPDGHTVVVGGIEVETTSRGQSRVPLFGGLPVIGELFKSRSNEDTTSRFFVFIRPSVLRHERFEDLRLISERDSRDAGVGQDWPTIEPMVIR